VICFNLISFVFPALVITIFSPYENDLEPWEVNASASLLFFVITILFGFGYLYYKKKLPVFIIQSINYLLNFELSRKKAFAVVIILLSVYVGLSVNELGINEEEQHLDYQVLEAALEIWPFGESSNVHVSEQKDRHIRMFLISTSLNLFNNIKIIPFLASISLLIVTYFLTKEMSGKRFAGIISMAVVLQSYTFLQYDTTATYESFWALFYVLSLYLIYNKWYLSPISYILSIFSKAVTLSFFPFSLFFLYRSGLTVNKKIIIAISYVIVIGISISIWQLSDSVYNYMTEEIDFSDFWIGMTIWPQQMRFDFLIIFAILPLTVGLFLKSRKNVLAAETILVLILGVIITGPIMAMFTDDFYILPYRFLPLVVFFAVGLGIVLSKN